VGSYSTTTLNGFKYFLIMIDDATKATWIFHMKSKFEVWQLILFFYTMVQTQFGINIKAIRSDNAMEFKIPDFYNSHGIIH